MVILEALKLLAPDRLVEPLLKEVKKVSLTTLPGAAFVLAELQETRALPLLANVITDNGTASPHVAYLAADAVAKFGLEGLKTLKVLLASPNVQTRRTAIGAVTKVAHADVRPLLQSLLSDPDPEIRQTAELGLETLPAFHEN